MLDGANPAACEQHAGGGCPDRGELAHVMAGERPVTLDRRHEEAANATRREVDHRVDDGNARVLLPPGNADRAGQIVSSDADTRAVASHRLVQQRRLAKRHRPDEHAVDTQGDRVVDRLHGAETAANLEDAAGRSFPREPLDQGTMRVGAHARASRIKVDDVQRASTLTPEATGDRERVVAEVGHGVEPSLDEAYDAAVDEVDCRDHLERHAGIVRCVGMAFLHTLSARVASSRAGAALFSRALPALDAAFARATGGRRSFSELVGGVEVVWLTTLGARTGLERTVPLLALPEGDELVVVASNWGSGRVPAWSLNLIANPEASVMRRGVTRGVVARAASTTERDRLWPLLDALYPGYRVYRLRAGREIALVLLAPL